MMTTIKQTIIGVFAQGQILCKYPNGLQAGHCDAPPPPNFGWPPTAILYFQSHFSSFQINAQLWFFLNLQNGCRRPFWMTKNHFHSHFSPFHINIHATFMFFSQNGGRRPFWMTENHFRSHFSPFQINTQLWFFFHKMAAGDNFKSLSIAFLAISDQYATFFGWIFFFKMDAGGHFGWPKITFDRISRYFRSIHNSFFYLFFSKWPPAAILEVRFGPKTIGFFHYVLSMAMPNMNLIGEFMTQLETPQAFWAFLYTMAARGHFVFPIDATTHEVLVIWDLNGYGEYEFDWCICDKVMACTSVGVRRRRWRR